METSENEITIKFGSRNLGSSDLDSIIDANQWCPACAVIPRALILKDVIEAYRGRNSHMEIDPRKIDLEILEKTGHTYGEFSGAISYIEKMLDREFMAGGGI